MKKLLTAVAVTGLSFGAFAADEQDYTQWVTLTNSDSKNVLSFAKKSGIDFNNWSDGTWPSSGKNYYVPTGRELWTTTSGSGHMNFAGRNLAVAGLVLFRSTAGYHFSMGTGGILLPGGAIRFNNTDGSLQERVSVESTLENPSDLQLNSTLKTGGSRGLFNITGYFDGETGSALRLYRSNVQSVLPVPDSTYLVKKPAFTNFFGTVIATKNVELQFDGSFASQDIPGTLQLDPDGYFTIGADNGTVTIGTLAAAGGVLRMNTSLTGETNPPVITNALTFIDEAKLTVTFGTWFPKPGAQKYPVLKLTGTAADSAVTADDFILDITSPMWRDLPKTDNPRIAIDETADGKTVSVEWPDEPEPFTYFDEDGNLVLDAATQYGNLVDDLSDGDTPLSVVKEGKGVAQIGPNSPFTGMIDVREGKLVVGNREWQFYRWIIKDTFRGADDDSSSKHRVVGLKSFGLFDAEGNDRVQNLSCEGHCALNSSGYWYTDACELENTIEGKALNIDEGQYRITHYNGTVKTFTTSATDPFYMAKLFMHSDWSTPNFWSRDPQEHPKSTSQTTWVVFTLHPEAGGPITSWDYVNAIYTSGTTYQMISNCTLEASLTGETWTQVGAVLNPAPPTKDCWQGSGEAYVAGFTTHTGGMAIDPWPMDPIMFAASSVSVAEGATLEARTGTAPVISDLTIDLDKGLGTIKGFAFAATGTLRITNTYGLRDIRIAADLSGVAGYGNLANWTILIDGKDRTGRRDVTVTSEGIAISSNGLVIIVAGNAGGAPASSFLSPTDGAVVPLLNARQKAFLQMSPLEVATAISNEVDELVASDDLLKKIGTGPLAVDFRWRPGLGKVLLTVAKKGAETTPFFHDYVTEGSASLRNFEVGARYVATLKGRTVDETIEFETEGLAPRCISLSGRSNTRDMGGRVMMNGRRVRQGLMYRTGQFEEAGVMRISEETRKYIVETLGIRMDIDLRQDSAVASIMANGGVSPLGPTVRWIHEWDNYHDYSSVHTTGADATKRIFRYMMDPANYPMVFHCAGGADRTGTLATLVHGVLGASDDEIWMDYYITSWGGSINQKRYPVWISSLIHSFDKFEGATISDRICAYFRETLGFTDEDLDKIRDIMLEPLS